MAALSGSDGVVKPATVIHWHRQGFRLYWRWRLRSGRPSVDREVRKLVREMSSANPLWGAPRIHGELLKLGIEISQATVAKYMMRRRGAPSPTWRSFLLNQAQGIAAIDMFVVAAASFRLLPIRRAKHFYTVPREAIRFHEGEHAAQEKGTGHKLFRTKLEKAVRPTAGTADTCPNRSVKVGNTRKAAGRWKRTMRAGPKGRFT